MVDGYKAQGLNEDEINTLTILDVKAIEYFNSTNQHGGIGKVASDEKIMGWLFNR